MEGAKLHHHHGHHSYESLNPAGGDVVHDESEHGGETKSAMKKVKAEVEKLKATIKHGHGHHDDSETVDDSSAIRSGLMEPTVMGKPVLAEDLYATHSDIVDPPVRSFAQWEEEERHGAPPPLSTGIYGTQPTDPSSQLVGHPGYGEDVNREQLKGGIGKFTVMEEDPSAPNPLKGQKGDIGKSTVMEEDPSAPNLTTEVSPATHHSKVTDPTKTGGKEAGITYVLQSLNKMKVYDEPESKTLKSGQTEPPVYTGSHDQFAPEPVQNPPLDTIAGDSSNQSSSYTGKITSATSAISSKATAAKDLIASKLGSSGENKSESDKPSTRSSLTTDYAHKVADTLTGTLGRVYEGVVGGERAVMSRMRGRGHEENTECTPPTVIREPEAESKGVGIKEYLVDTFRPGDDDKVLSEVITHAFHRGKANAAAPPPPPPSPPQETVIDEGERRLQESGN